MLGSSSLRRTLFLAAMLAPFASLGCEGEKRAASTDAGLPDAGSQPPIDPKLSAAVAAAASANAGQAGAAGASGDGPPEGGVFAPGKADALLAPTAVSKIELMNDGSEPRVKLGPKLDGGAEQKTVISIGVRTGAQSALPTIDYALTFKAEKPKAPEGDAPKTADRTRVVAKVTSAKLSPLQPGQLPKELEIEVNKLKGSLVRYELTPDGASTGWKTELAKGAAPALETTLQALADGIAGLNVPAPQKPVGAGAYWMVSDRAAVAGIDVVRYRVFRLQKVDKVASLSIEVRQYAANEVISLGGGGGPKPAELALEAFDAQGKGAATLEPGALFPGAGELGQKVQARLKSPGQPKGGAQRPGIQIEVSAKIGGDAE